MSGILFLHILTPPPPRTIERRGGRSSIIQIIFKKHIVSYYMCSCFTFGDTRKVPLILDKYQCFKFFWEPQVNFYLSLEHRFRNQPSFRVKFGHCFATFEALNNRHITNNLAKPINLQRVTINKFPFLLYVVVRVSNNPAVKTKVLFGPLIVPQYLHRQLK